MTYYLVCSQLALRTEWGVRGYRWVFILTIYILMEGEKNSDFLNAALKALLTWIHLTFKRTPNIQVKLKVLTTCWMSHSQSRVQDLSHDAQLPTVLEGLILNFSLFYWDHPYGVCGWITWQRPRTDHHYHHPHHNLVSNISTNPKSSPMPVCN